MVEREEEGRDIVPLCLSGGKAEDTRPSEFVTILDE
jgi:hypothetical protein